MATIPVSKLRRPMTRDEAMEDMIELGDSLKLRTSSWRGPARWFLIGLSELASRCTVQIAYIASMAYNETAYGDGLKRKSISDFDNTPLTATRAHGTLVLSDPGGVGPVTFPAGTKLFAPKGEFSNFKFENVDPVTVPLNSVGVEFEARAQVGGASHNDIPDDSNWDISPVYAGIQADNPPNNDGPVANWLTQLGTNNETATTLRTRNRSKWSTISGNGPSDAYVNWALSSRTDPTITTGDPLGDPVGITRAIAPTPPGDGTLIVYVATDDGAPTAGQVSDCQAYIDARKSIMSTPTVVAATEVTVPITGTVTMSAGTDVIAQQVTDALTLVIKSTPIGGTPDGGSATLIRDSLICAVKDLDPGVIKFPIADPSSDVALTSFQVAVPGTNSITIVEI